MLVDARTLARDETLETDLCIVGAGAAGITMALEFAGRGVRVALLESGGFEADAETSALNATESVGRPYRNLRFTRTRLFGGSTNCWEGMCRPLEKIDFQEREWIPYSGWPIDFDDLLPYYQRAQVWLGLGAFAYDAKDWATPKAPVLPLDPKRVSAQCFQVSPRRFGKFYRKQIVAAPNVTTVIHANVVEFETHESGRHVNRVRIATLGGGQSFVRAKRFVLAVGGLENPRLLLASRSTQPAGIGNEYDLVGRFFMEHPHAAAGAMLFADAGTNLNLYKRHPQGGFYVMGCFGFPAAVLERERMTDVTSWFARPEDPNKFDDALGKVSHEFDAILRKKAGRLKTSLFVLENECEQAPNPDSRVSLGSEHDALGMPRLVVDWQLSEIEKVSLVKAHELLAGAIGRASLGRMRLDVSRDNEWPSDLRGGAHHMGTTRMAHNPRRGVVDADCRVHGVENLFVAGSSVFPTGGASNPTLTLLALTLRLSDHLKRLYA